MAGNPLLLGAERRKIGGFRERGTFDPLSIFQVGEQGLWADPSDLTPEKVSWRRNLLTWSESFENSAWTKTNSSVLSNLLTWSEDFTNSVWQANTVAVTANQTAGPDGATTADLIAETVGVAPHSLNRNTTNGPVAITSGVTYTYSVFLKKGSGATAPDIMQLSFDGTTFGTVQYANFNIANGTVGTTAGGITASIVDVGNGWYRCRITAAATSSSAASSVAAILFTNNSDSAGRAPSYTGVVTSNVFAVGAQLVPGTTAETYTRTTSAAAPILFADPFGGTTAQKLVAAATTGQHYASRAASIAVTGGVTYSFSIYAKRAERNWLALYLGGGGTGAATAFFNLTAGTVGTVSGGVLSTAIDALGNDWFRCTITATSVGATLSPEVHPVVANGSLSNTGDGVSGIYIDAAQIEAASTASSYQRITDFTSDFLAAFPTHALYQDSAGTTPVTALGQPVGLVIDKRLGGLANLGPELIQNGDFSQGSTGWTTGTGWSIANGVATHTGSSGYLSQSGLTVGRLYQFSATITASGGGFVQFPSAFYTVQATFTTSGSILCYVLPTSTTLWIFSSGDATIDNISVREVPGNHAIQATSASRPTCDARVNLLTYSEQFDNAAWTKGGGATIVANAATAPDGTATADKLRSGAVSGESRVQQSITVTAGVSYTFTGYAKRSEWRYVYAYGDGTVFPNNVCIVDLETGVITANTGSSGSITAVGDGWYRVQWTATALSSGTNAVRFGTTNSPSTVTATGDGTSGIFIWGADHRVTSDNALPYQRVVTASDYADVQAPRYLAFDGLDDSLYTAATVDFATWTSGARRNLLTYPSAFSDPAWTKAGATVSANVAVAPDGTNTADAVIETATAGSHSTFFTFASATAAATYTYSVYVKAGSGSRWLRFNVGNNVNSWFDVATGQWGTIAAGYTNSVVNVGNGWYRVVLTGVAGATTVYLTVGLADANNSNSYTGDGTSSLLVWGAQLELGTTATTFQDVGTDKVSVFTGVRKLSDAAAAILCELSTGVGLNTGSFYVAAPETTGASGDFSFRSRGSTGSNAAKSAVAVAPTTQVLTGIGDIASDTMTIRLNGAVSGTNTEDQGTGTYGIYVFYIGRRAGTTLPFNGRIYQLLVRGAATDSGVVNQVERWVASKTGVVLP